MVKIDKTELFRSFVIFEVVLVGIPVAMFWSLAGILTLFAGSTLTILNLSWGLLFFRIYFILPGLVASRLFQISVIGFYPKGLTGWLFSGFIYSFAAFILALVQSLYTPSNRCKASIKE